MSESAPQKFNTFYIRYPRREARKDAEKAWKQVNGDARFDEIMAALDWQVPLFLDRERNHRPLPATYLRGERWTDENPNSEQAEKQAQADAARAEMRRRASERNSRPEFADRIKAS